MKTILTSILVDNQDKALKFYTEILGFIKKHDVPIGDAKWLTVIASEGPDDVEILLEPNWNPAIQINGKPAAAEWQKILFNAGIPAAMFGVTDIEAEYARLSEKGVRFTQPPAQMGPVKIAVLDDTCGNLVQIMQK
ncbi:MAG TPA: VOC family protein [Mucilaginibacter sp.]|jgi:catechol 2,3-dioxygenase-like lactoylglutathione lyase family enzyme|nr:VOC family protein [Mucilaginibacter sp.]